MSTRPIRRALVSVYDKTGLVELAQGLHAAGVTIVSTGSTAARVAEAGVPVVRVEEVTGFPECLDGRVKTLHPAVHAGILADVRREDHRSQLEGLGIDGFDLVVSNLYPFTQTVISGASEDECVEQIDIGGPAMVRAAAKNHASVAVVVDPRRYPDVLAAVQNGGFTLEQRRRLAAQAFTHTATYDVHVASWMGNVLAPSDDATGWPGWMGATYERAEVLRYGENPHQRAALYRDGFATAPGLAAAELLHGKAMSYNNYVDTEAALRAAHDFAAPCVAIIKHANPCGIAIAPAGDGDTGAPASANGDSGPEGSDNDAGDPMGTAHRKAHACDPVSAFGGVIAANRPVSVAMAAQISEVFTEVVAAPGYDPGALEILARKPSIRVLRVTGYSARGLELHDICGGLLLQVADTVSEPGDDVKGWDLVVGEAVDAAVLADLEFAWRACRSVKSNAIVLAAGGATVGIGMGQVNRVDSARLAAQRAGERARGSVAASDAFFPFADGLRVLVDAGVRAVVQPGGSKRDDEVRAAAEQAGVAMYFTGVRHFFH